MTLLFLGYSAAQSRLHRALRERTALTHRSEPVHPEEIAAAALVVSFGYRHILRPPALSAARRPILNLHMALLPYNRGAHPNFWAWYEGTPQGVTIHEVDAGLDTGPILLQRALRFPPETTLAASYAALFEALETLFLENWDAIRDNRLTPTPQSGQGTSHRIRDLPAFEGGWDQTIAEIRAQRRAD